MTPNVPLLICTPAITRSQEELFPLLLKFVILISSKKVVDKLLFMSSIYKIRWRYYKQFFTKTPLRISHHKDKLLLHSKQLSSVHTNYMEEEIDIA